MKKDFRLIIMRRDQLLKLCESYRWMRNLTAELAIKTCITDWRVRKQFLDTN